MVMIWNIFNYQSGSGSLDSIQCCCFFDGDSALLVEVSISLILVKASLLDEESYEAKDSQGGHSEADSVVPWEASILLDSRGSRLSDSLEEHSTVFVSLVRPILVLVEVMLILILANSGTIRVSLVPLPEVVVTAMLLGLVLLLSVTLLLFGLVALRVSLVLLGLIVLGRSLILSCLILLAILSLVLFGVVLPVRRLVHLSVAVMLTDLLFVVLPLLVFLFVVVLLVVVLFIVPLSELLSQIKSNLGLHGLKLIALELGPQVERDLRPQLGVV